jgi:hypothetical protein
MERIRKINVNPYKEIATFCKLEKEKLTNRDYINILSGTLGEMAKYVRKAAMVFTNCLEKIKR